MRFKMLGLLVAFGIGAGVASAQSTPRGTPASVTKPATYPSSYYTEPVAVDQGTDQKPAPMADAKPAEEQPAVDCPEARRRQAQEELKLCHYGPYERSWLSAGMFVLWMKDGPAPGPLAASGGRVLFGNDPLSHDEFYGWQVNGGRWFNDKHTWGVEFGAFATQQKSLTPVFAGGDLSRPVINAITTLPANVVVSSPGVLDGGIAITANTEFGGGHLDLVRNLRHCEAGNFDLLFGFRYADLDESLNIAHQSRSLVDGVLSFANQPLPVGFPATPLIAGPPASPLPAGSLVTVADRFYTRNQLYAGEIGGRWEMWRGPFYLSALGKVALGPNHETQKFIGASTAVVPGGPNRSAAGGLLVLPVANLGRFTTDWFTIAPEVGLTAGVQVSDLVRVSLGYNFFYLNSVIRPASQVNQLVNPSLVPSSATFGSVAGVANVPPALFSSQPRVFSRQDDFLAHGISVSVEFRY